MGSSSTKLSSVHVHVSDGIRAREQQAQRERKKMDRVSDDGAEIMGMNTYQILDRSNFMKVSGRRMLVLGGERWEVRRHRWVRAYEVSPEAKNGLGPVTWESGDIEQNGRLDRSPTSLFTRFSTCSGINERLSIFLQFSLRQVARAWDGALLLSGRHPESHPAVGMRMRSTPRGPTQNPMVRSPSIICSTITVLGDR